MLQLLQCYTKKAMAMRDSPLERGGGVCPFGDTARRNSSRVERTHPGKTHPSRAPSQEGNENNLVIAFRFETTKINRLLLLLKIFFLLLFLLKNFGFSSLK